MPISQREIIDNGMIVDKDVAITLKDGAILYANIFRPRFAENVPVIIAFTPYGKDSDVAVDFKRYWDLVLKAHPEVVANGSTGKYLTWEVPDPERWIPDGYAIAVIDARGTGKSPGYYDLMGKQETYDLYDCIEWCAELPWSNGKVGLLGVSYLAIKQWQVAALQPPALKAIIPWEGLFDHYRDHFRHGGIFSSFFQRLLWDTQISVNQNGNPDTPYRDRFTGQVSTGDPLPAAILSGNLHNHYVEARQHELDDAWYALRTPDASRIKCAVLSAGNWGGLGLHLRGNVWGYEAIASEQKWLEMHTDTHFGSMYLPEAVALQKAFFGHFLKGEDTWRDVPAATLTIRDPRGEYRRTEKNWPLEHVEQSQLNLDFDAATLGGSSAGQITFKSSGQGVTFMTESFELDVEFTGHSFAKIWAASSSSDMDLFLTLRLYDEQGNEFTFVGANDPKAPVTQGWLRASHRELCRIRSTDYRPFHLHQSSQKLSPGEPVELDIELMPTSLVVPRGWRLGLTISGSDFARPDAVGLMKGSGIFMHDDPEDRNPSEFDCTITLSSGPERRSYLSLPQVKR